MALPGTVRKLGPGVLTIGSAGSALDFSGRCTKAAITWKVTEGDNTPVLSGEVLAGDDTFDATLEATVQQDDLTVGDLIDYSWANKGAPVPFTFTPYTGSRSITGTVKVQPIDVGGDVDSKNSSDLKWGCVGEPALVDDLT